MTAEQQARDMLERMGVEDAQSFSSGDLVELANLIAERGGLVKLCAEAATMLTDVGGMDFRGQAVQEAIDEDNGRPFSTLLERLKAVGAPTPAARTESP